VLAVGCLQAGPCGWQPTGATPAPLIPVWCRCIPACGLSGVE